MPSSGLEQRLGKLLLEQHRYTCRRVSDILGEIEGFDVDEFIKACGFNDLEQKVFWGGPAPKGRVRTLTN